MFQFNILKTKQTTGFSTEYTKFVELMSEKVYSTSGGYGPSYSLESVINFFFPHMPFVGTSRDVDEYFRDRGWINYHKSGSKIGNDQLAFIQFILVFFDWVYGIESYETMTIKSILRDGSGHDKQVLRCAENLLSITGYKAVKDYNSEFQFLSTVIVRQNPDVDTVLNMIEPSVSSDLQMYLDFRIERDINAKEAIISRLYKSVLEKNKQLYIEHFSGLYKDAKYLSSFVFRHYNGDRLTDDEKLRICDDTFLLIIHLIRSVEVDKKRKENKRLLERIKSEMKEDNK